MLRPRTLVGATFVFNHRRLERSQRPEGVGKSAAQLLTPSALERPDPERPDNTLVRCRSAVPPRRRVGHRRSRAGALGLLAGRLSITIHVLCLFASGLRAR